MTIDFECAGCGADFEIDFAALMEDATKLQCPNCDAKADTHAVEDLIGALDDVMATMAILRRKFNFTLTIEADDLPPPYGPSDGETEEDEVWEEEIEK
jgi:DNA-directed RNA polymerase subunit RPC12/RpoP